MVKQTIYIYLFFTVLFNMAISFIGATYVMFLLSHGLNLFEVGLVNAVFFTTLIICEIPTGIFADIFGRKVSYVLSYFLLSLSMFVYAGSGSFFWFAVAEAIGAIGGTFANGAFTAWLKDRLNHHGYDGPLKSVFAREAQIRLIAGGISALAGAYLAVIDLALPWIVGGVMFFIGGILAIVLIKEEYFKKEKFSFKGSFKMTKRGVRQGFENKAVKFMLIMGLLQFFAVQAPNMQWQPYFLGFLEEKSSLGYIYLGISVFAVLGSFSSLWILKKMKDDESRFLTICQILIGLGIFFSVIPKIFAVSLSIFLFHEFARGLFLPVSKEYINKNIPSGTKERATILSMEGMSHHIGGAVGLVVSGLLANYLSIPITWMIFGAFLFFATSWIYLKQKAV